MTRVFILMVLILTFNFNFNLKAQETVNNFSSENNKIIWQKVIETEMDFNQFTDKVKELGILGKVEIGKNKITGQTKLIDSDFKGAGYLEMTTPMYVARSFFDGFCMIEFKDGKYRITLKNIMLTQKYDDGLSKEGEKTTIETYAIKSGKNEIKNAFSKSPSIILDFTFTDLFNFELNKNNDNW